MGGVDGSVGGNLLAVYLFVYLSIYLSLARENKEGIDTERRNENEKEDILERGGIQ